MAGPRMGLVAFLDDGAAMSRGTSTHGVEDVGRQPLVDESWSALLAQQQQHLAQNFGQELQEAPSMQTLPDRFMAELAPNIADPEYIKYYYGNRNLNPRLPPPSLTARPGFDSAPGMASKRNTAELHHDSVDAQTAALSMLLNASQQIQESNTTSRTDAFGNLSHLTVGGSTTAARLMPTQRFASSCAILGDVASRNHSFTSGMPNPWAPSSGSFKGLTRNDLATNSATQAQQLEGLMNAFSSPRTSFSNSVFSGQVANALGRSSLTGLDPEVTAIGAVGTMVDPIFGGGIASASLSPRSSATSMQAQLLDPMTAAVGSPVRGSPMSQSFTLGSAREGKASLLGHSFGANRSRAPSKLRVGSTVEFLPGLDLNPITAGGLSLNPENLPSLAQSFAPQSADISTTPDITQQSSVGRQGLSEAEQAAVAASLLNAASASANSPSQQQQQQQQQQQLQAMYLAMQSIGYGGQMNYGGAPAPQPGNPYPVAYPYPHMAQQAAYPFQQMQQMPFNGLEMLGMQAGMPGGFPPVSPAEYAAYYQRYMDNQQAVMAAAIGVQQNMHLDPFMHSNQGNPGDGTGGVAMSATPHATSHATSHATNGNSHGNSLGSGLGGPGSGLCAGARHRSHGGGMPRGGAGGYRNSGELLLPQAGLAGSGGLHGPGSGSITPNGGAPGMGGVRSENGVAEAAAVHLERLNLGLNQSGGSGGGGGLASRRSSRRDTEGALSSRSSAVLEEFKANKARRFEFSDALGHMYEFSLDQHGSRFIQQKLEVVSQEELNVALNEVLPRISTLMTDVFGNYVIQKFFDYGAPALRQKLAESLKGQVLQLSLQMYGCRVIQKALEVLPGDAQVTLLAELDGNVMRCVRDQNGNHVIQKVIECVPTGRITALLDNFLTCVVPLSSHPFGCRVMQRILEHCKDEQRRAVVMDEILRSAHALAQDQYGNYVIQHVLEHGNMSEKQSVVASLTPHVVALSMHKFASNVVEKCLTNCTCVERDAMIKIILGPEPPTPTSLPSSPARGNGGAPGSGDALDVPVAGELSPDSVDMDVEDSLQQMMKDQFGNYVVQRVLEVCDDQQRDNLLHRVRAQLHLLKKFTYGKHIVARVEKLLSAGTKIQSHLRARPLPNDTAPLSVLANAHSSPAPGQANEANSVPEGSSPNGMSSVLLHTSSLSPENSVSGVACAAGTAAATAATVAAATAARIGSPGGTGTLNSPSHAGAAAGSWPESPSGSVASPVGTAPAVTEPPSPSVVCPPVAAAGSAATTAVAV